MIPILTLIGRTNVGKSTLFNRLIKNNDSIIYKQHPELTRDRRYGEIQYNKKKLILVDTGSYDICNKYFSYLIKEQIEIAIKESIIILFIIDGKKSFSYKDLEIFNNLRKFDKKIYILINKIDYFNRNINNEYFKLGNRNIYNISAMHGYGIDRLLYDITSLFHNKHCSNIFIEKKLIKIAFVGRTNVGKSTLINSILNKNRFITSNIPGTTLDSTSVIYNNKYIFIDTAGIIKKNTQLQSIKKISITKTFLSIKKSNLCVIMLNFETGLTHQDISIIRSILSIGKPIVVVINKYDLVENNIQVRKKILYTFKKVNYFFNFLKIRFISALYKRNINLLLQDINTVYESSCKNFSTSQINNILKMLLSKHKPPHIQGGKIKIRYARILQYDPITILIFGNKKIKLLPQSYKRYLTNEFIRHLHLTGIFIKFKYQINRNIS